MLKNKIKQQVRRHSAHCRNKKIDKEIKRQKIIGHQTHRVLIVGPSLSGKTTIVKQMQDTHFKENDQSIQNSQSKSNMHFENKIDQKPQNYGRTCTTNPECWIQVDQINYNLTEVGEGGPRLLDFTKMKWASFFGHIDAIMFVADCSTCEHLKQSLQLFKDFWPIKIHCYPHASLLLIINKSDLMGTRMSGGEFKLTDYFPEFSDYESSASSNYRAVIGSKDQPDVLKLKNFILDQFLVTCSDEGDWTYPRFTCALDSENMNELFGVLQEIIQRQIVDSKRCACGGPHPPEWLLYLSMGLILCGCLPFFPCIHLGTYVQDLMWERKYARSEQNQAVQVTEDDENVRE